MIHSIHLKSAFSQVTILAALLSLASCDKSSQDAASQAPQRPETLAQYDVNKDGKLSDKEKKTMNDAFVARFDVDGDNKLNIRERDAARKKATVTVNAASQAPMTLERAGAFLKRFDKDGDGMTSESEAGADRWKVMSRADKNGDKVISAEEWLNRNTR